MHGAAPTAAPVRCPPRHFFDLPWALRVEIIGEGVFVGGIVLAAMALAALAAYLYDRRRRARREKMERRAAEAIAALQARAESAEKERRDLLRSRAVEEGCAAAEVVSRRADEVMWRLEVWRRALDEQAGHFSPAVSPGGEVEVPLPPPRLARRNRWSCSV